MDSRRIKRDEEELQEELLAEQATLSEADAALTPEEEQRIMEAIVSVEAGGGLDVEEGVRELENFEDL